MLSASLPCIAVAARENGDAGFPVVTKVTYLKI
jgi:hypothetical protein